MQPTYQLVHAALSKHFFLGKARLNCMCMFIFAMIQIRTVNLVKLSHAINHLVQPDSSYIRLKRFIREISLNESAVARLISSIALDYNKKWILILDRTNWKIGKVHINILYLAVSVGTMAIPLFWSFLIDKKCGNSDYEDRSNLLKKFIDTFGLQGIDCLTADREFIGKDWFDYLQQNNIQYVIRSKDNRYITNSRGKFVQVNSLCYDIKNGDTKYLSGRKFRSSDTKHQIAIHKNEHGELLVLIYYKIDFMRALDIYRQRWNIEVMFKHFKKNGFDLETTHVTQSDRLYNLTVIMAIAFVFAYKLGSIIIESKSKIWKIFSKPVIKKHGRLSKSIFRLGLDAWGYMMTNLRLNTYSFVKAITQICNCNTAILGIA